MARPPIWRHLEPKPTRSAQRIMVPYEGFNECLRSLKGRGGGIKGQGGGCVFRRGRCDYTATY